jgi:hypothetical protein
VLEDMAASGELEKVSIRQLAVKDENRSFQFVMKSRRGQETLPPELRPPGASQGILWVWKYKGTPEQLARDEPGDTSPVRSLSLVKEFADIGEDPQDLHGQIEFIDMGVSAFRRYVGSIPR